MAAIPYSSFYICLSRWQPIIDKFLLCVIEVIVRTTVFLRVSFRFVFARRLRIMFYTFSCSLWYQTKRSRGTSVSDEACVFLLSNNNAHHIREPYTHSTKARAVELILLIDNTQVTSCIAQARDGSSLWFITPNNNVKFHLKINKFLFKESISTVQLLPPVFSYMHSARFLKEKVNPNP